MAEPRRIPDEDALWFVDDMEKGLINLRPHLREGLRRYLVDRIRPGAFLQAVIRNDLAQAVLRADENSLPAIRDIILFLCTAAPGPSHGSPRSLEEWIAGGTGEGEID
ncbi:hypothetical protein [Alteraurantiacibacter palmitatis]|uniref:Uncharacterized protein n=1 Tax=Alteraurantiacibacter palmitatis TaxID=2054628 RepID=A0ABV7E4D4_9SPHN